MKRRAAPAVRIERSKDWSQPKEGLSMGMYEPLDFHSARTPWDKNYITIPLGASLKFDWTANFPGVFMYHCGTAPVLHHISNGMCGGALVVDPNFDGAMSVTP